MVHVVTGAFEDAHTGWVAETLCGLTVLEGPPTSIESVGEHLCPACQDRMPSPPTRTVAQ